MSLFVKMAPRSFRARKIVLALWAIVFLAIPIWAYLDASGWDLRVYHAAIQALRIDHDPYADAIAIQIAYHAQLALHPNTLPDPPYNYVYSPVTLPLLRLIGKIPDGFSAFIYWLVYATGVLAVIWAGMHAVEEKERKYFVFLAPITVFFPGLLENGVILSGNIAYIVYGAVLVTAVMGWQSGRWRWFYLAVLGASCFKAPLLTLLVIPVLSVRRQWIPAGLTAATGVALFVAQPMIWPVLFGNFLHAVELQVSYNRDFGSSPAGMFAGFLFDHGLPYSHGGFIFYLLYAVPLFGFLVYLSNKFMSGYFPITRWIPVLLLGVILLNPRIIEYDLAILTIPFALIGWRLFPGLANNRIAAVSTLTIFVMINVAAYQSWIIWKNTGGILLVSLFSAGAWQLLQLSQLNLLEEVDTDLEVLS